MTADEEEELTLNVRQAQQDSTRATGPGQLINPPEHLTFWFTRIEFSYRANRNQLRRTCVPYQTGPDELCNLKCRLKNTMMPVSVRKCIQQGQALMADKRIKEKLIRDGRNS